MYKIPENVGTGERSRREKVITHLRIGHTVLNYALYKMGKDKTGLCEYCKQPETVTQDLRKEFNHRLFLFVFIYLLLIFVCLFVCCQSTAPHSSPEGR